MNRPKYGWAAGLGLLAASVLAGCGGGGGMGGSMSGMGTMTSPTRSMGTLVLKLESPPGESRITSDTTSFEINVVNATTQVPVIAPVTVTIAELSQNSNTVTISVPAGSLLIDVTALNSFGAIVGNDAVPIIVTPGEIATPAQTIQLSALFTDLDLNGTFVFNSIDMDSLTTSETNLGTVTFDGGGNVTAASVVTSGDGSTQTATLQSGTYQVNSDGSFTATMTFSSQNTATLVFSGHINSSKDIAPFNFQITDPSGTRNGIGTLVSHIGTTFTDADLSATVGLANLSELINTNPINSSGTFTTNSAGQFTGGSGTDSNNNTFTVNNTSTYSVASDGTFNASLSSNNGALTTPALTGGISCVTSGQDVVMANLLDNTGKHNLVILTDLSSSHGQFDLAGSFGFHTLNNTFNNGQGNRGSTNQGVVVLDNSGGLTIPLGVSDSSFNGSNQPVTTTQTVTPGTFTVQANGAVQLNFNVTGGGGTDNIQLNGFENNRGNFMSGTGTSSVTGTQQDSFFWEAAAVSP